MVLARDLVSDNSAAGRTEDRSGAAMGQNPAKDSATDTADYGACRLGHVGAATRFGGSGANGRADEGERGEGGCRTKPGSIL